MEPGDSNPTIRTMETMRAIRDFKQDRVEDAKLREIFEAAVMAPSSSNSQPWEFVVVRDPEKKAAVGAIISEKWHKLMDPNMESLPPDRRRLYEEVARLADNTAKVPVLVLACIDLNRASKSEEARYASIYPAVQNLMLAAWSLGLGTCITTHASSPQRGENEVKEALRIPKHIKVAALVYLGYPSKPPKPPTRVEAERAVHYDVW